MTTREVAKFGVLVGFAAIFVDAAIAHGLFWDNDPYWTYWITKTFLITTVFTLGTAFLGTGVWQGLVLTAVHTLILEIYYQWLAPVGLPQEPEWLDFDHLWVTGVPAHYLAILGGYFIALWAWRRSHARGRAGREAPAEEASPAAAAVLALFGAAAVVVLDGVVTHGLLLREFPGLTYFVQHLLIACVFLFGWIAFLGFERQGWAVAAFLLALVFTTYGMYLGPQGLPADPPRYLGYDDLWTKAFPGALVAALLGLWLAGRFLRAPARRVAGRAGRAAIVLLPLLLAPAPLRADEGLPASAAASGPAMFVVGPDPVDMTSVQPAQGTIRVAVVEAGNRWSHVQNLDSVDVAADFAAGGSRYQVRIARPMPRHPLGRYTTWSGVVYNHEMHGDTGIGTAKLPKMKPEIALYGWAEVRRDGRVLARMAPAHVMVTRDGPGKGIMLEVDTEEKTLAGTPDGYLTVMWPEIGSLEMPESAIRTRRWIGWAALLLLVAGFWRLAGREEAR